jgi:integrase
MAKRRGIYKQNGSKNYWIRYAGLDGKTVYESSHSINIKDADTLLASRRTAIAEGKQPEVRKIQRHMFRELAERYLGWVCGRQKSARNRGYVVGRMVEKFGNLPLRSFNTSLVEQFQTELMNKNLKNSSCNTVMGILKRMFTKAVEWEMVEEEVLKRIRKVKPLRDNSRRMRFLAKEECQMLINACDQHLKPIVVTALNTGMRKGEILSLEWEKNIDLKHDFILLDNTKNGERREIPINANLRQELTSLTRRLDVPYVFYKPSMGQKYDDVKRSFHSACRRAGVKDFHFHDLRHTFASHLVMAGVDLTTVSRLLGHKSLGMTLRYSHLAPAHMAKAVKVLDGTFNEKLSSVGERFTQKNYIETI